LILGNLDIEKSSYTRKKLDFIEIPPIYHFDASLKQDLKFHAPFLAMYISKMKRNRFLKIDVLMIVVLKMKKMNGKTK
jgi:hypothetical protein